MSQEALINLSVIILFLPLLGFIVTLFAGMKFKWAFLLENAIIVIGFLLSVCSTLFKTFGLFRNGYRFGIQLDKLWRDSFFR